MANPLLTKKPRKETTVRRIPAYLGPDKEIRPEELELYERVGGWIIQPKIDGMWCALTTGHPTRGLPNVLKSRDARTPEIKGANAGTLPDADLTWWFPEGSILVGELEAASQWATQQAEAQGFRRLHVFDLIQLGDEDLRGSTTLERYATLVRLLAKMHGEMPNIAKLFPLVFTHTDQFRARYDRWLEEGYEGCVIKKADSLYKTSRLDGKTNEWLRCKKHLTEDYVLVGVGQTPGGKTKAPGPVGIWGLYVHGKLQPVMRASCPAEYYDPKYFGSLVAEYMGWEKFASGALRHAQWVRVREDKSPEQCMLRVEDDASQSPFPVLPQAEDIAEEF